MKQPICADDSCELPARLRGLCLHHYIKAWKATRQPVQQGEDI